MLKQDDPKKCTAAKLVKFGLANNVHKTSNKTLVLDPFAEKTLLNKDKKLIRSVTGIDCSWSLADKTFVKKFTGIRRKLPPLFAGNPVNYSKLNKLTTVEAISAALYILGHQDLSLKMLDKFKWGHTFYELNKELLGEYSKLESENKINSILLDFGISL
ncbi:MAG: putative ribosome biogenesis protein [Marine Group I thaumarchaeote]|jgi:pre-rRNA-processing protein TSR3|nr:MAG: putative ribosome biogenesis protein [Marine Group I thaumarchaeote]